MSLISEVENFNTLLVEKIKHIESQLKETQRKITNLERITRRDNQANALDFVPGSANVLSIKPKLCLVISVSGNLATCSPIVDDPNRTVASNLNTDTGNNIIGVWVKDAAVNDIVLVFYVGIFDTGQRVFLRSFVGIKLGGGSGISIGRIITIAPLTFIVNPLDKNGIPITTIQDTIKIFGHNTTLLSTAFPFLKVGQDIPYTRIDNSFYCLYGFSGFEVCTP